MIKNLTIKVKNNKKILIAKPLFILILIISMIMIIFGLLDFKNSKASSSNWALQGSLPDSTAYINDFVVYNGNFYASSGEGVGDANIYKLVDGVWTKVYTHNDGNGDGNMAVNSLYSAPDGNLYFTTIDRGRVYRYNGATWPGPDDYLFEVGFDVAGFSPTGVNHRSDGVIFFNGYYYAATGGASYGLPDNRAKIYKSPNGNPGTWTKAFSILGNNYWVVRGFTIYNGRMYFSVNNASDNTGAKMFSTDGTFDGDGYLNVVEEFISSYVYLGKPVEYDGKLYVNSYYTLGYAASDPNWNKKGTLYVYDGTSWDDIKNTVSGVPTAAYSSLSVFNNKLYIGTGYVEDGTSGIIYTFDGTNFSLDIDLPGSVVGPMKVYNNQLYANSDGVYFNPPYIDCGLRGYDGTQTIIIACEPPTNLVSPLRIAKNGNIYGVVLVDLSDSLASKIKIRTSSGVKVLRRF